MWTSTDTPVGPLRVVAVDGAITEIDFLGEVVGTSERASTAHHAARAERPVGERDDDDPLLARAVAQLARYFDGELVEFDLPLAPRGTPFQLRVWEELRHIPYGSTASYGEIARKLGLTGHGARAVGLANGRNPIPVVVPCHRVVGADGGLTGYGGGVDRKRILLDLERGSLF
jgi:methylated-DNA-[protein]-cysteine S-methyltransferase